MPNLAIQYVSPDRLRPYPGNARTHSRKQIKLIAASIKRFGFTNPILVTDDFEVVAGHGRLEAAKSLGMNLVPVVASLPTTVSPNLPAGTAIFSRSSTRVFMTCNSTTSRSPAFRWVRSI